MGVASTMKPEMGSVLERQLSIMLESRTSKRRTRRGGVMSGEREAGSINTQSHLPLSPSGSIEYQLILTITMFQPC